MDEIEFDDAGLKRLEKDTNFTNGLPQGIVKAFRKRMQYLRAAQDERDLYAWKSLHYEKMQGDRSHQRSMRLNDQMRLVLEIKTHSKQSVIHVICIEDYH